jgi:hypothetical protein
MGKKSLIEAIKKIEMDSGSWSDDQLDELKDMDLKELKKYIGQYDNWEEYASKKKTKPTKVATAQHGGLAKRGYGVARRG